MGKCGFWPSGRSGKTLPVGRRSMQHAHRQGKGDRDRPAYRLAKDSAEACFGTLLVVQMIPAGGQLVIDKGDAAGLLE